MTPKEAIQALLDAHWKQVDIAKAIDISPASITKILAGTSPKYETGLQLVALGRKAEAKLARSRRKACDPS